MGNQWYVKVWSTNIDIDLTGQSCYYVGKYGNQIGLARQGIVASDSNGFMTWLIGKDDFHSIFCFYK